MSEGFAIELYFDPALENQVLKAWNVLSLRQITSQLINIGSRPHINLFSTQSLEPQKLEEMIKNFASKQQPLSITMASIGTFSDVKNRLFLAPSPSLSLLQLQTCLCDELRKMGVEIGDEYCRDSWIPHCLVAQDVPKNRMEEAFCVLRDLKLPISGCGIDIALVEVSPMREIFTFSLGHAVDE